MARFEGESSRRPTGAGSRSAASTPGIALLLAGLATACGAREAPPDAPPDAPWKGRNVLLISIDTLRADHLSIYGYERPTSPRIDRFFEGGAIYTRAYSAEAATAPSVVSMLTGLVPARHGVRLLYQKLEPDLVLLPDLLRGQGYQTSGVVSNIVLTDEASDLARHFDHYDDFVAEREPKRNVFERRAARTTRAAARWLAEERDPDRPHFQWVHYIDPHGPYRAPEDKPVSFTHEGEQLIDTERIQKYQRIEQTSDGLVYVDRYDEEIAYVDREVGRLLDAYEAEGLLAETVVLFTADHGETMMEHRRCFTHGYHVWEAIMRVPLLIRAPGAAPVRREHPVSLVDLLPTLATNLGFEPPPGLDGHVLDERPASSSISLEALSGDVLHRARVEGNRKWFVTIDAEGEVTKDGWLDVTTDAESPAAMRAGEDAGFVELLEWVEADPDPNGRPAKYAKGEKLGRPKKVAPGRTERQLEALRELGYVE